MRSPGSYSQEVGNCGAREARAAPVYPEIRLVR